MDDLDRMFSRLVHNIRTGYPQYLTQPFEVSELYQQIIPYRHNRAELGMETNQDYEVALCQLLAGDRGYLATDEAMRDAIHRELATSNPNTAIFREFAASRIALAPDAARKSDQVSAARTSSAPAGRAPSSAPPAERRAAAPPPPPPPAPPPPVAPVAANAPAVGSSARASTAAPGTACHYCGGSLPLGRRTLFCPHCGQNLTVQRCPACSTELEMGWKFCINCGRGVSAP